MAPRPSGKLAAAVQVIQRLGTVPDMQHFIGDGGQGLQRQFGVVGIVLDEQDAGQGIDVRSPISAAS